MTLPAIVISGTLKICHHSNGVCMDVVLVTNNGDVIKLNEHQSGLLWYLLRHDLVKEGEHVILGTD